MRRNARGFTLMEMMIVVSISLAMMVLIVPIFRTSTNAVKQVERKLALYEAARNILDILESEIKLASVNERGGHFSITSVAWEDDDASTPAGVTAPGPLDTGRLGYRQSRREADQLGYVKLDPGGFSVAYKSKLLPFPGSKAFPLAYPTRTNDYPEAWRGALRTSLLYQTIREWYSSDFEFSEATGERWNRSEQLADVSTIEASFVYYAMTHEWKYWNNGSWNTTRHYTEVPDMLGPGMEIHNAPYYSGDQGGQWMRRIQGIKVVDLDFAYWDETQNSGNGKFMNPTDTSAIYFWPAPKALRVTITAMDREKRGMITLCRVVQIPVGAGSGATTDGYGSDTDYDTPPIFNRIKNKAKCTRKWGKAYVYTEEETRVYSNDRRITGAKTINQYKTPLNWNP
ncbi:MAG: prepilin-type N-terminal cleavage/methylation domain-containing protein [Planctomycetota bacterium]|nr:prepilin-type N-terminal cleavage/methylation domain-containing protein [Planctomycetota bacterium]